MLTIMPFRMVINYQGPRGIFIIEKIPGKIIVVNDRLEDDESVPFIIDQTLRICSFALCEKSIQL